MDRNRCAYMRCEAVLDMSDYPEFEDCRFEYKRALIDKKGCVVDPAHILIYTNEYYVGKYILKGKCSG